MLSQCSACASILGFEDDVLRSTEAGADGGEDTLDASFDRTLPGEAMSDAATDVVDAAEDATDGPSSAEVAVDAPDAPMPDEASAEAAAPDAVADADACSPIEICNNGIDDNCNGLVDCADPMCTGGFACIPMPPVGWTGPVELWEGAIPGIPPSCGGAYPSDVYDGNASPTQPPDACSACACSSASGVVCGAATVTFFDDSACTAPCADAGATSAPLPVGTCVDISSYTATCTTPSVTTSAPTPSGGACSPSGGTASPTPWTWTRQGRVCGVPTPSSPGGCAAGMVCAPRPAAPFDPTACVVLTGDQVCPATFPGKQSYYAGANDARTCTACGCGAPSGAICSGTVQDSKLSSCTGGAGAAPAPSACRTLAGNVKAEELAATTPSGGICAASGGQPTGSVAPTSPTTICCAP